MDVGQWSSPWQFGSRAKSTSPAKVLGDFWAACAASHETTHLCLVLSVSSRPYRPVFTLRQMVTYCKLQREGRWRCPVALARFFSPPPEKHRRRPRHRCQRSCITLSLLAIVTPIPSSSPPIRPCSVDMRSVLCHTPCSRNGRGLLNETTDGRIATLVHHQRPTRCNTPHGLR